MMDCYKVIKIMFMSIFNILGKYLLNNENGNSLYCVGMRIDSKTVTGNVKAAASKLCNVKVTSTSLKAQ